LSAFPAKPSGNSSICSSFVEPKRSIDRAGCFAYSPVEGAAANQLPGQLPDALREERRARFMAVAERVSIERLQRRVGQTLQVLIDSAPALGRKGGVGRSFADAPEIDGTVRLLPPEKASKTLKVGEFTKARVVATEGHDLIAMPI
jgi:ribosomal protein S12 methylthiotransferase